jgi:hypothetical protein
VARILTNNPTRGSMSWNGLVRGAKNVRRSVRRLMKVDPTKAQGTSDSQLLVGQNGIVGRSGASPVRRVLGRQESTQTATGSGVKRIRDRSANRSLKRR